MTARLPNREILRVKNSFLKETSYNGKLHVYEKGLRDNENRRGLKVQGGRIKREGLFVRSLLRKLEKGGKRRKKTGAVRGGICCTIAERNIRATGRLGGKIYKKVSSMWGSNEVKKLFRLEMKEKGGNPPQQQLFIGRLPGQAGGYEKLGGASEKR